MFLRATLFIVVSSLLVSCSAQDQVQDGCYTGASIFGAVVVTLVVVLVLLTVGYLLWRMYWRTRRGKHLVLVTDTEKGAAEFAFDNPVFREGTPIGRTSEKEDSKLQVKWPCWTPLCALNKSNKPKALDDSYLGQPMMNVVPLRSHDFTGLGFNICGNMRDGIFVKDVLHRGPASESGRIVPGDRIESIRISFRHMVFEDALTILSYASPYEVQLEVENGSSSRPSTLLRSKRTSVSPAERICHPFYRSQSISDLSQMKSGSYRMSPEQPVSIAEVSNGDVSKPAVIETSPIERLQKFGVRVLPPSEPIQRAAEPEKHQNVRNSMIESTHVQGSSSPSTAIKLITLGTPMEDIDLSDSGQNLNNSQFYDETDAGSRKETPSPATKENNVKSILVKGIQNLKEKLQPIVHKLDKDPDDNLQRKSMTNNINESDEEITIYHNRRNHDDKIIQKDEMVSKQLENAPVKGELLPSSDSEIPEEVQKAGIAARNVRRSVTETERKRQDSSGGESSNESDSQQPPKKGKRKAPQPPQVTENIGNAEEEDIPDTVSEKNHSIDSADTDSEAGDKSGTTIELNASHITVHHAPDAESNRKAASLGDLSRIDDEQHVVVLERAVSLDLADGTPGGCKKRKAPLPPQGEEFSDEGGSPFSKGARLDNGVKARLKKSSDWGTLEDAVKCSILSDDEDEETDAGISGCSTPEKSPDLMVSSTPYHDLATKTDAERVSNMHVSSCSWDLNVSNSNSSGEQFITAVNGTCEEDNGDEDDIPPDLPTSPMPTYITEIQVVTTPDKVITNTSVEYPENIDPVLNVNEKNLQHDFRTPDNLNNLLFDKSVKTNNSTIAITNENEKVDMTVPHFLVSGLSRGEGNMVSSVEKEILFPSQKIISSGDTCQVSISQPNSLDVISQDTISSGTVTGTHLSMFSNENMSDEQILALKSSSPEPNVLDSGTSSKLQIVKPDRQKNNVSVTSIKAGGSRIPVRTPPEPAQRKVKWSDPVNFISYSSLNVTGNGEKQPFVDRNGTEHNVTQIFLDPPK